MKTGTFSFPTREAIKESMVAPAMAKQDSQLVYQTARYLRHSRHTSSLFHKPLLRAWGEMAGEGDPINLSAPEEFSILFLMLSRGRRS